MPSMSLSLRSFPLLTSAISFIPIEWNQGPMYNVLLTNRYVRISELGIQWCSLCETPAVEMSDFPRLRFFTGMGGWHNSLPCGPTHNAFCRTTPTANKVVTLFPTVRVDVALNQNVFADALHACHSQTSNRNIATMNNDYQVLLCDIVHSKLDFVLYVEKAIVYWRIHDKPLWWSLCVTLSCLFFFTRVCDLHEHAPAGDFALQSPVFAYAKKQCARRISDSQSSHPARGRHRNAHARDPAAV
jgi:hypothetical protein